MEWIIHNIYFYREYGCKWDYMCTFTGSLSARAWCSILGDALDLGESASLPKANRFLGRCSLDDAGDGLTLGLLFMADDAGVRTLPSCWFPTACSRHLVDFWNVSLKTSVKATAFSKLTNFVWHGPQMRPMSPADRFEDRSVFNMFSNRNWRFDLSILKYFLQLSKIELQTRQTRHVLRVLVAISPMIQPKRVLRRKLDSSRETFFFGLT